MTRTYFFYPVLCPCSIKCPFQLILLSCILFLFFKLLIYSLSFILLLCHEHQSYIKDTSLQTIFLAKFMSAYLALRCQLYSHKTKSAINQTIKYINVSECLKRKNIALVWYWILFSMVRENILKHQPVFTALNISAILLLITNQIILLLQCLRFRI